MALGIEEILVETWWSPDACRPVVIAESTYRLIGRHVFDWRFGPEEARALAALLTGLDTGNQVGVDAGEVGRSCVVDPRVVKAVLARLSGIGLLTRHHRGYEAATGRRGWSWQLAGGLFLLMDGPVLRIEPKYHKHRHMITFHARRLSAVA